MIFCFIETGKIQQCIIHVYCRSVTVYFIIFCFYLFILLKIVCLKDLLKEKYNLEAK